MKYEKIGTLYTINGSSDCKAAYPLYHIAIKNGKAYCTYSDGKIMQRAIIKPATKNMFITFDIDYIYSNKAYAIYKK